MYFLGDKLLFHVEREISSKAITRIRIRVVTVADKLGFS